MGVLASVGLIAFMQSLSQAVGIVIIVFSGLWYQAYTDGVTVTPEVNDA
ncbi:hypothetical protein [Halolamina pelagica]|nr:hypothetical protein [Halolamina pelagica]